MVKNRENLPTSLMDGPISYRGNFFVSRRRRWDHATSHVYYWLKYPDTVVIIDRDPVGSTIQA